MGNVVDHIQAGDVLLAEQIDRVGILLAENRHQDIGAGHFLLAGSLHVEHGSLQNALEAQSGLRFPRHPGRNGGHGVGDEIVQLLAQALQVDAAGAQDTGTGGIVQHGEQQMLHGDELVLVHVGVAKRRIQGMLQLFAQHSLTLTA